MARHLHLLLAGLLSGGLCSCATASAVLVAPDGSHRLQAGDPQSGLTVVITTDVWDGDPNIDALYTPVHFLISNQGTQPVRLAPGDFEFVDRRGFRYPLTDMGHSFTQAPRDGQRIQVSSSYPQGADTRYRTALATRDLSEAALPWGFLAPGTSMRGFVFFDPVVDSANGGVLRWYAASPQRGPLALFEFELAVARSK